MDGPVPMGKLIRQRERRYKKIYDDYNIKCIYHKFNKKYPDTFDSNKISPATEFMNVLHKKINECIESKYFGSLNVIFSDSNEYGEGEYKLFEYIRNSNNKYTYCIYSLDADIIILSMLIRKTNIFIHRIDEDNNDSFIDISLCKKNICDLIDTKCNYSQRIINDLCFLSLLGGNDFVQPQLALRIRDNGWNNIIDLYLKYKNNNGFIIDLTNNINIQNFNCFLLIASLDENKLVNKIKNTKKQISICHQNLEDCINDYHHGYLQINDDIDYSKNDWYLKYQDKYLTQGSIKEYIKSIIWCWKYYNGNICSWSFYYPYHYSPPLKLILSFMNNINVYDDIHIQESFKLNAVQQLCLILPPQSHYLLPTHFQNISKQFHNLYPLNYNMLFDTKMIYSVPILTPLFIDHRFFDYTKES